MSAVIIAGGIVIGVLALDWMHERRTKRLKAICDRKQISRDKAIEYSKVSRKDVTQ